MKTHLRIFIVVALIAIIQAIAPLSFSENSGSFSLAVSLQNITPPPITLKEAIKIAEEFIEKEQIDVSKYYLKEVRLIWFGENKERCWYLWWDNLGVRLGDYVEIRVDMDGKAFRIPSM